MKSDNAILDMLSLIYEDLDVDAIEERFVNLVADLFSFERVGLFFVKHKKGVLQGKLCKGFEQGIISSIAVPIADEFLLTRPLITGSPLWNQEPGRDPSLKDLGLDRFALIPVVSRKRISCWQLTGCEVSHCPAYGNRWLRCWLLPGTKCRNGTEISPAEKIRLCESCPVFNSQDGNTTEGILLVDGPEAIEDDTVTMLSIIAHAVGTAINNSKKYFHALREAIHDDLTGLHNRRYFNERLFEEIERTRRHGGSIGLLFGDIDNFKQINDTYGHPVGDAVLKMLGGIFQDKLRRSDLVSRYGGEEFAILLFDSSREQAIRIAENLRRAIAAATLPGPEKISVTISFGVAAFGEASNTLEGLISKADEAMYDAKSRGKNRVGVAE